MELHVEEPGDDALVPGEAGLDGALDDGLHARPVPALAVVVLLRQLRAAAPRRPSQHQKRRAPAAGSLHCFFDRKISDIYMYSVDRSPSLDTRARRSYMYSTACRRPAARI